MIKGVQNQRKIAFTLAEKGKRDIEVITKASEEIQSFLRNMSSLRGWFSTKVPRTDKLLPG